MQREPASSASRRRALAVSARHAGQARAAASMAAAASACAAVGHLRQLRRRWWSVTAKRGAVLIVGS
jgi:hypothetical protein